MVSKMVSGQKKTFEKNVQPVGFDVIVEQKIGFVEYDDHGYDTPMAAAMHLVAKHAERLHRDDETGQPGFAKYHFLQAHELVTIEISVG